MRLGDELAQFITPDICSSADVYERAIERLKDGRLTKDEDPISHFCTHFAPYDSSDDTVLLVDHKRAKTWIFTGGHVDKGETLLQTLNREIKEELGIDAFYTTLPRPFLLTRKDIVNDGRPCLEHFDLWFRMDVAKENVRIDMDEFHAFRWTSYEEGLDTLTDENNRAALRLLFSKSK